MRAVPILPSRNLDETRTFYERLGFQTTGWWPQAFGGYAILMKDDLEMHFFAFPELSPLESYGQCYWRVESIDAFYAACAAASQLPDTGVPRLTRPENKPWSVREFALVDPSGNLVRVGERIAK